MPLSIWETLAQFEVFGYRATSVNSTFPRACKLSKFERNQSPAVINDISKKLRHVVGKITLTNPFSSTSHEMSKVEDRTLRGKLNLSFNPTSVVGARLGKTLVENRSFILNPFNQIA